MFTILEGFGISDRFENFHASCVPWGLVRPFGKFLFLEIKKEKTHILDLNVPNFICSQTRCFDDIRGFWDFQWFREFLFVSFSWDSYIYSFREVFVSRYKKIKADLGVPLVPKSVIFFIDWK